MIPAACAPVHFKWNQYQSPVQLEKVLVTNPPVLFGIFFVLVSPPVHQSKTYVDKHVAKGGGTIFLKGKFSKIFWGVENFSYPPF